MAITEENRHKLYQRLDEVLGTEQATTLMEHLPPVGWADVATKRDLDAGLALAKANLDAGLASLRSDIDAGFALVRADLASTRHELRAELHREVRTGVLANLVGNSVLVALVLAAARLL